MYPYCNLFLQLHIDICLYIRNKRLHITKYVHWQEMFSNAEVVCLPSLGWQFCIKKEKKKKDFVVQQLIKVLLEGNKKRKE